MQQSKIGNEQLILSLILSELVTNFSFRREQLIELMELLDIPDKTTYKRNAFCGEEVFLRGLYEVCTGENQERMAMNVFGGDQPRQSCAFSWFIDHMFDNFEHLVKNNRSMRQRSSFIWLLMYKFLFIVQLMYFVFMFILYNYVYFQCCLL